VPLECWYEFASTYSYLAVTRVEDVARAAGASVTWRPFLLGPIFAAQGWNDSPFNIYPAKGRYMWRDLERRAAARGMPFRRPSRFPRNGLLAARVALVAADEGWAGELTRAVFRANFAEDREIAEPAVLGEIVRVLGRDPDAVLERAGTPAVKAALRAQTTAAQALGIFGAPSFVARGELFWGDDRLEDAVAWLGRASG
jgi:2-hydroxychromene-2-carboxylate isomerase